MTTTPGEPDPTPNVHQCIVKAMALVDPVGKAGVNREQGYKFKRIDDFMTAANQAMAEAGVHMVPRVLTRITDENHFTSNGKTIMRWVDLEVEFEVFGPGGDSIKCVLWGEGRDAADKATNKALTAAQKYALMYLLMVPTADIQDADSESPEAGRGEQSPSSTRRAVSPEILALQQQILDVGAERKLTKDEIVAEFAAWLPGQNLDTALTIGTADAVVLQGFIAHLQAPAPPAVPAGQDELPGVAEPGGSAAPKLDPLPADGEGTGSDSSPAYVPGDQPPPVPDDIDDRMARARGRNAKVAG